MMSKPEAARAWCLERIGCPYLYGGTGQVCTVTYRQARMAQYPQYAQKMRSNCPRLRSGKSTCQGCRWADENGKGRRAYDCAQFARWCMNALGIDLVSGATSQWRKTPWAEKGEIAAMPRDRLCLVFREDSAGKMGHVGVYLGDGTVAHAKGHDWGVVRQKLDDIPRDFTHYGIPAGLYDDQPVTYKKGCEGGAVRELQEMLLAAGMLLPKYGADGKYGAETTAAVITFQARAGLPETGEVDPETWAALEKAAGAGGGGASSAPEAPGEETAAQASEPSAESEKDDEAPVGPTLPPDCEAVPRMELMQMRAALESCLAIVNKALEG